MYTQRSTLIRAIFIDDGHKDRHRPMANVGIPGVYQTYSSLKMY